MTKPPGTHTPSTAPSQRATGSDAAAMAVRGARVAYGDETAETLVFEDLSLEVQKGEFVSLIGPSGCGKSTLLHCLGGLLRPQPGTVVHLGNPVKKSNPRLAAFVFQDYSLLPWKNVIDNVSIGLKFEGMSRRERTEIAEEKLDLMGLLDHGDKYPAELSGGMQQRVAVARALAMEPDTLLLDEPFGALDEQTRRRLGLEISTILTEQNKTVVLVTHSLDEALYWGDRVVVMGERPEGVVDVIDVAGGRPRDLLFMTGEDFDANRARLLRLIDPLASK